MQADPHQRGAGEEPVGQHGVLAVVEQQARDGQAEHRVAEELERLVVGHPTARILGGARLVGQRVLEQAAVAEAIARHERLPAPTRRAGDGDALEAEGDIEDAAEIYIASAAEQATRSADTLAAARLLLAERSAEQSAAALVRFHRARLPAAEELYDDPRDSQPRDRAERPVRRERGDRDDRPDREPRDRLAPDEVSWFRVTVGRKNNADPKWLIPMICRLGHVTKKEIGSIRIFDRETKFEIAKVAEAKFREAVKVTVDDEIKIEPAGAPGEPTGARPGPRPGKPPFKKAPFNKGGPKGPGGPRPGPGPGPKAAAGERPQREGERAGKPDRINEPGLFLDLIYRKEVLVMDRDLTFSVELRNLTNEDYEEYLAAGTERVDIYTYDLGRTLSLGVSAKF